MSLLLSFVVLICQARLAAAEEPPPSVRVCIAAYERGQELERAGKLVEARRMLTDCAVDACPVELRADCSRWLTELAPRVPSVVIAARTADGRDVIDGRIVVDGKEISTIDGLPMEIDAGMHMIRLESPSVPPLEQRIVIREGEQIRRVDMVLPRPLPPKRPIPWPTFALAGAGVAATATFGYFAVAGNSARSDLSYCMGFCTLSSVNAVSEKFVVANVSLGVAIAAFGAAAVVFLTRPSRPTLPLAASMVQAFSF
jgi:hypothetical protein